MTFDTFTSQMTRLEGLKFGPDNLHTHWEGLRDVSVDALERAVSKAVRECESYPSPAEIRRFIIETAPAIGQDEDRSVPLVAPRVITVPVPGSEPVLLPVTREWTYYCTRCNDTGWASFWCGDEEQRKPWHGIGQCERPEAHAGHEYARHCVCWESNPAVVKKRERAAQQASHRTAKERG